MFPAGETTIKDSKSKLIIELATYNRKKNYRIVIVDHPVMGYQRHPPETLGIQFDALRLLQIACISFHDGFVDVENTPAMARNQ